jgi:hypothetical protein
MDKRTCRWKHVRICMLPSDPYMRSDHVRIRSHVHEWVEQTSMRGILAWYGPSPSGRGADSLCYSRRIHRPGVFQGGPPFALMALPIWLYIIAIVLRCQWRISWTGPLSGTPGGQKNEAPDENCIDKSTRKLG